jgi:hypothetical protein
MSVAVYVPNVNETVQLADGISANAAEERIRSMLGLRRGAIVDNNNIVMSGDEPLHSGINYTYGVMEGKIINFVDFSTILTTIHRHEPFHSDRYILSFSVLPPYEQHPPPHPPQVCVW